MILEVDYSVILPVPNQAQFYQHILQDMYYMYAFVEKSTFLVYHVDTDGNTLLEHLD